MFTSLTYLDYIIIIIMLPEVKLRHIIISQIAKGKTYHYFLPRKSQIVWPRAS